MRKVTLVVAVLALAACSKKDETPAVDTTAAAPAPVVEAPRAITLADMAGTWAVVGKKEGTDSTLVTYDLVADTDSTWGIQFPDRKGVVSVKVVSVSGDSIVTETGKFPSAIRKGVTVQTTTVMRLVDGKLAGRSTARYSVKTADSVLYITTEGTRK